ncbi:hypothetical protein WKH57_01260 [Niallia taxi]|uniref:hypothetical protein n=1 Tax=Niallia taxi TaxID=2499688 RepID=UPI00317D24E2
MEREVNLLDNKFSQLFIDTIVYNKKFNFEEVKSNEELRTYYNELKEFNADPDNEKYRELLSLAKNKKTY